MNNKPTEHELFRSEVLEKKESNALGRVLLKQPSEYQWMTYAMFAIVLAVVVFLLTGTYTKYADVFGVITVDKGIVKVGAVREGQITQQRVKQGEHVKKGDLLYVISTERHSSKNQNIDENILQQQQELRASIERDLATKEKTHELGMVLLKSRIEAKRREVEQLKEQVALDDQRLVLSEQRLARNRQLFDAGHMNQAQLDVVVSEHLDRKSQYTNLVSKLDNIRLTLAELENELALKPSVFSEEKNRIERSLIENEQRIVEVSSNIDYRIYAPTDGTVGTLYTHLGEYVQKGTVLSTLIPQGSMLQAELYVPTNSIGFIQPQQSVAMRYSAFPYQHFGLQHGTVHSVAKVISLPEELETTVQLTGAVYKVIVDLESQFVEAKGEKVGLGVGMELEASIQLEDRTLMQWILEPIYSLRNK